MRYAFSTSARGAAIFGSLPRFASPQYVSFRLTVFSDRVHDKAANKLQQVVQNQRRDVERAE
jgi:hypothetical protein